MTYCKGCFPIIKGLLQLGVSGVAQYNFNATFDSTQLLDLLQLQGVIGIAFDGVQKLSKDDMPNVDALMEMLGQTSYLEEEYKRCQSAISSICNLYEHNGMKTLILKGYGISLSYPNPKHRPCGDIDVYLLPIHGNWDTYRMGNSLIESKNIKIDYKSEKHSTFTYEGYVVENHVNFFHIQVSRREAKAEKVMQELLNECGLVEHKEENFTCYFPSPQMNYFYLLRHMAAHFRNRTSITLRHLIDWGVFLHYYGSKFDLVRGQRLFKEFGLVRLNDIFTSLAADITGYDLSAYIINGVDEKEKQKILDDILSQEPEVVPKGKIAKIAYKTKEFFKLTWKYKYFNDNIEKAWFGLVNNLRH